MENFVFLRIPVCGMCVVRNRGESGVHGAISANSVVPPLLSSISQAGGITGKKNFFALITAMAFSYIRTEFGASRSRRVGVRSAKH